MSQQPLVRYEPFGSEVPLAEPSWCACFFSLPSLSSSSFAFFFFLSLIDNRIAVIITKGVPLFFF